MDHRVIDCPTRQNSGHDGPYKDEGILSISCLAIFVGTWIDKGMGLITGGFVPTSLHEVVEYIPTLPELVISCGVYGIGLLILTVLIKIAVTVKTDRALQIT